MEKNISEKDLTRILGAQLEPSEIIDAKLSETYEILRNAKGKQKSKRRRGLQKVLVGIGSVAAVFVLMTAFCVMNPVLASEIPILGNIFTKLSDLFPFGQIPVEDTVVLYHTDEKNQTLKEGEQNQSKQDSYTKKSGDITVTLTEQYASNQAIYIGVHVENAKEFPNMVQMLDGTQSLRVHLKEQYSFRTDTVEMWRDIDGKFENKHTFDGILRIDYSEINVDDRKYQQALKEASGTDNEEVWITDENWSQYLSEYEIPEMFTMKLDILNIVGDLAEPMPMEGMKSAKEQENMTDEEWEAYMKSLPQDFYDYPNKYQNWWQEGSWSFDLTIEQKDSQSRVVEVNETNEAGIGLKSIEISSVELTFNTIEKADTVAVALDANGNKIENGSSNMYELAIADHDISKVYVYICDYEEYIDKIKAYGIEGNHFDKSFQEILEERALFKTVVDTTK